MIVEKIKKMDISIRWHHIKGKRNPSDTLMKDTGLTELKDSKLWWNGPEKEELDEIEEQFRKRKVVASIIREEVKKNNDWIREIAQRTNNFEKMWEIVRNVIKFINLLRQRENFLFVSKD
jgi:hypothetical protein